MNRRTKDLINRSKFNSDNNAVAYFKKKHYLYIGPILCIIALLLTDMTSLFSYGYALVLLVGSSYFFCRQEEYKDLFCVYHIYFFFAILFYALLKYQFPEYMGLNGGEGRMDDNRFYAQLVEGNVTYFYIVSIDDKMPYVIFLKWIYPFKINTPLNILAINVIFSAFLPIFVRRLANLITNDSKIGRYSFIYSLWCPFTLFFGCIILRESITATFVIAGLCYFIEKKYVPLFVCIVGLAWIRFGTLAFLLCGILLLFRFQIKRTFRSDALFVITFALLIVLFYFSFSYLQDFSGGKLGDSVIRSTEGARYEESTIGKIMMLPFPVNIILSTLFFWFIPLFSFPQPQEGHFILKDAFQSFCTPLFMFFLWNPIYNTVLSAIKNKRVEAAKKILYMALLFALLLGTISMQSRHKTVLFPILCLLAAYGKVKYNYREKDMSFILAAGTIGIQVLLSSFSLVKSIF